MFTSNPFAELSASISPAVMQTYVVVMAILVVAGTLFDVVHKGSAKYFFENMRASKRKATQQVGSGEKIAIAVQTAVVDVAMSGEFCNQQRRVAHLLGMYGFIIYVVTTVVMVFAYPTLATPTPPALATLWYIGALMVCLGGYWFWFFIRVDVAAEGSSPFRFMRADLFIVSLLLSATFGLLWAGLQTAGAAAAWATVFLALYLIATTVLFAGIPWSKFSHMFFKPAAAFEKRVSKANGSAENLPTLTRDDPEQQKRHSMELLRDAPMRMGLGIKREAPRHY
jgi:predicted small integral membrane protein